MGKKKANIFIYVILCILTVVVLYPLYFIVLNSFKGKFYISKQPFELPKGELFAGLTNYTNGLEQTGLIEAAGWSFFITIVSVVLIIFFTSMTAYYVTRVKGKTTSVLYYLFVFSMVVPFQMVMFTMVDLADKFHLRNPLGMCILYLGFGAGLSVFMFSGFVKSIPLEIEEAAMIDGCNPLQTFFGVVLPVLKPTCVTVAILQTMWIWNDYLLPYLVLDLKKYVTIPIAVQYLKGGYGSVDMGAMMGVLVLAIIPIIIFYLFCQRYIIEGVVAGAVKG